MDGSGDDERTRCGATAGAATPDESRDDGRARCDEVTDAVIREVAAVRGESPLRTDPLLGEVIDPDALNALFRGRDPERDRGPGGSTARLSFTWAGCRVVVHGTGEVEATPAPGTAAHLSPGIRGREDGVEAACGEQSTAGAADQP